MDPVSGKISSQMAQQLQQAQQASGAEGAAKAGGDGASFGEVLQRQQAEAAQQAEGAQQAQEAQAPEQVQGKEEARLESFVQGVMGDEAKIDAMMDSCLKGESLSQGELLQMQALIYGYSQKVDLATKVVEKTTGGLKQMMNTQV